MTAKVRGLTPEERAVARAKQTRQRRAAMFQHELVAANTGAARVKATMRFVMAVAKKRTDRERFEIADSLLAIANDWNKRP